MKGSGAGWDSCIYRALIIGGFLTVIGGTVITTMTQPPNSKLPLYVGVGSVAVFMVLIVGYWVVQIIFKGYGSLKAPDLTQAANRNDLSILQSWNSLFAAMVTEPGDAASMKQSARRGNSSLIIWFLWAAVIALCPIAMMVPYAFGVLEWSQIRYAVMFYIGIVIVMSFLSIFLGGRSIKAGQEVLLEPLGLKITRLPEIIAMGPGTQVRGATVMEGTRFGRPVAITVEIGRVTTTVRYNAAEFVIQSKAGYLEVGDDAPQAVRSALRGLRKAKRWEGLKILGDKNGISATRGSVGQNIWLYDLWLIERIIAELDGTRGA